MVVVGHRCFDGQQCSTSSWTNTKGGVFDLVLQLWSLTEKKESEWFEAGEVLLTCCGGG